MKKGLLTVLASVLVSGLTAYAIVKSTAPEVTPAPVSYDGASYRTVNLEQTDYPDFTYAAESAVDAVVYVAVTVKTTVQQQQYIDPFELFFGYPGGGYNRQPQEREQRGAGSGVIIRPDGYIVTNNHVVNGATEVQVVLNNNKTYEAKVIGTDEATDVALIKIDAEGLPTIPFADSDKLRLGEWVLAIGSPYNLRSTITAGIVSAKGRSTAAMGGGPSQGDPRQMRGQSQEPQIQIESFIQTDAVVNPGNSGGALVNKAGELVGINTMIYSQTGSYAGYSFAVPSNIVHKIVEDLIDFGSVKRARLGITMRQVTEDDQKELKLSSLDGVYIEEVSNGSTADKGGLKKGDVLVAIDGAKVTSMSYVQEKVNGYRPGDKATLSIIRNGNAKDVEVEFQGTVAETGTVAEDGTVAFYGSKLRKAPKETLDRLGLKSGVEIVSVGSGKLLDAGASEGFVILYVNDQAVSKPEDVIEIANKSRRAVYIEGVTAYGKSSYFGFGKE
jgi:Do/DeqQ family serine protease